jgi:hypothetical protein
VRPYPPIDYRRADLLSRPISGRLVVIFIMVESDLNDLTRRVGCLAEPLI